MRRSQSSTGRFCGAASAALLVLMCAGPVAPTLAQPRPDGGASSPSQRLRIVGGLAGVNQYTRHEAPFWRDRLAVLTDGRYDAEIVPFDRAGIRGAELLTMVRLGSLPFGTLLLSQASPRDAELAAPDLAGLSPDMPTLRRVVTAWRPHLTALLRERHGAELLAVYTYPAQVLFCNRPVTGLASLQGLRVRTSSPTQSDFVRALGGIPLTVPFAQLVANMQAGNMDCAITGTMSGYTIGLHEITTHLLPLPVTWGLSVFVANRAHWQNLPQDLRAVLLRELPRLESAIWDEAERETDEGVRCSTGSGPCTAGVPGRMKLLQPAARDDGLRRTLLAREILSQWVSRCGESCVSAWNQWLAPVSGVMAVGR